MISFHLLYNDFSLKGRRQIKNWLKLVIETENKQVGQIDIILCEDTYLLNLNITHLNHHFYTDILTFNYSDDDKVISGDLYISLDRIKDNAHTNKIEEDKELKRVMVHGVLHLLGYNDRTDDEKNAMRKKENIYLQLF